MPLVDQIASSCWPMGRKIADKVTHNQLESEDVAEESDTNAKHLKRGNQTTTESHTVIHRLNFRCLAFSPEKNLQHC